MSDRPVDIYQRIRRALLAQKEIGLSEITLSRPLHELRQLSAAAATETTKAVSVAQALSGGLSTEALQTGFNLMEEPRFSSLDEHYQAIHECQQCPLGETRTKFVYGVGNPEADLMFIGEAPGADEDRLGEPFVGRAGKLLDKILAAMGLSREEVYIANILKCRPPGNRDPQPAEMDKCFPYLREQIRIIRPRLLCALGRIAGQALLKTSTPLGKLRNRWHEFEGVPLLVTYHPAALLRFPAYKRDTWEDMQRLKARYDELRAETAESHGHADA
ncbi:MAG: uracil-DNA glycosylase [Candidatus Zixiibacteriota bacterium]|nr:MAG: uracil-DNA glycosylase [candidate division Zixibacteria bacterium]